MKLLIVGSRSIKSFELSPYITSNIDTIISGGANGGFNAAAEVSVACNCNSAFHIGFSPLKQV